MSRDSRLWQDSQAHGTIFEGDVAECTKWLGIAKARLRFMLQSTPGATSVTWQPGAEVTIKVDSRPNQISISVQGGLYLESGFLNLINSVQCSGDTYTPATLHFNTAISAYLASTPTPLQAKVNRGGLSTSIDAPFAGQSIADGAESKSVGCAEKLASINPCGTELTAGGYCDPAKILMKKKCQYEIPASIFSGKLRLYVQAIYGSTRDDYTCQWDSSVFDRSLFIDGFVLHHSINPFLGNHHLLTTANYDYFIVKTIGNTLYFYPLKLPPFALKMRELMLFSEKMADKDFVRRVEAYLLAYATIEPLSHTISATGAALLGQPAAYGWHWDWEGLNGAVVLHEADMALHQYNARVYKINIAASYAAGIYSFTANITIDSSAVWWPIEQFKMVFRPNFLLNDTDWVSSDLGVPKTGRISGGYDAPIYCVYNADDALEIWSLGYSLQVSSLQLDLGSAPAVVMGDIDINQHYVNPTGGSASDGTSFIKRNGTIVATSTLRVGSAYKYDRREPVGDPVFASYTYTAGSSTGPYPSDYSDWREPGTLLNFEDWMVAQGYWINTGQSATFGTIPDRGDGFPASIFCMGRFYRSYYDRAIRTVGALNFDASQFIEIPAGDCDNVIYGKSDTQYTASDKTEGLTTPARGCHSLDVVKFYDSVVPGVGSVRVYLDPIVTDVRNRFHLVYSGAGLHIISNRTTPQTDYFTSVRSTRDDLAGETDVFTSTAAVTGWHFQKAPADGMLGAMEKGRSALQKDMYKYEHIAGSLIVKNHQFSNDSSIGWA